MAVFVQVTALSSQSLKADQSDPHVRRRVLQTGPVWNFTAVVSPVQSVTVTLLRCARQDRKLQLEVEKRGGDEERRPCVPLTWSHVGPERKRRRTGSGKRDVEQILLTEGRNSVRKLFKFKNVGE